MLTVFITVVEESDRHVPTSPLEINPLIGSLIRVVVVSENHSVGTGPCFIAYTGLELMIPRFLSLLRDGSNVRHLSLFTYTFLKAKLSSMLVVLI